MKTANDLCMCVANILLERAWTGIAQLRSLSCEMQCHGFNPILRRIFSGRGDFSLGVNMGSDSIPQNLFWMRV